jgi:hypothetical protein
VTIPRGFLDDVATVLELVCDTCSYRADHEQRALLNLAYRVDADRFKDTTTNKQRIVPYLEAWVDESRRVDEGDKVVVRPSVAKLRKKAA